MTDKIEEFKLMIFVIIADQRNAIMEKIKANGHLPRNEQQQLIQKLNQAARDVVFNNLTNPIINCKCWTK